MKRFYLPASLIAAFVLWTLLVCFVDVQTIGPQESSVGLATINIFIHSLTGVHWALYTITDWLGLIPVAVCLGFGILGLVQWMQRKALRRVDFSILVLGGFYIVVIAAYLLFESWVINYRPVLIAGFLEASYPSSTTLLVMCVMPAAMMQCHTRIRNKYLRTGICYIIAAFIVFMVIGRMISGVHWFSDIIGGAFLSAGLVTLYHAIIRERC